MRTVCDVVYAAIHALNRLRLLSGAWPRSDLRNVKASTPNPRIYG